MTQYNKPFLSFEEQISLLEDRGLIIEDKEKIGHFLQNISYYHLSIYTKAFQDGDDKFIEGTTFENVLDLYKFDKKLRLLLLDMLERIEMSFKCVLAYQITKNKDNNYWYIDGDNFSEEELIEKLLDDIKNKSKEIYIQHFYKNYSEPEYPPAWLFFENLTFGECSRLARSLYDADTQTIAGFYKLPKRTVIQMFYYLSHLRNVCAHHSRVWNRKFVVKIAKHPKYENIFGGSYRDSLYSYLVVAQIFLVRISPDFDWLKKIDELIKKYHISVQRMGFPEDWRNKLESVK